MNSFRILYTFVLFQLFVTFGLSRGVRKHRDCRPLMDNLPRKLSPSNVKGLEQYEDTIRCILKNVESSSFKLSKSPNSGSKIRPKDASIWVSHSDTLKAVDSVWEACVHNKLKKSDTEEKIYRGEVEIQIRNPPTKLSSQHHHENQRDQVILNINDLHMEFIASNFDLPMKTKKSCIQGSCFKRSSPTHDNDSNYQTYKTRVLNAIKDYRNFQMIEDVLNTLRAKQRENQEDKNKLEWIYVILPEINSV